MDRKPFKILVQTGGAFIADVKDIFSRSQEYCYFKTRHQTHHYDGVHEEGYGVTDVLIAYNDGHPSFAIASDQDADMNLNDFIKQIDGTKTKTAQAVIGEIAAILYNELICEKEGRPTMTCALYDDLKNAQKMFPRMLHTVIDEAVSDSSVLPPNIRNIVQRFIKNPLDRINPLRHNCNQRANFDLNR